MTGEKKGLSIAEFRTDETLEEEGAWVPYAMGFEVRVARIWNKRMARFVREKDMQSIDVLEGISQGEDKEGIEDVAEGLSRYVLLDWKNLLDDDGKQIPYSVEKAKEYLLIKDFRVAIIGMASKREFFKIKKKESVRKNS